MLEKGMPKISDIKEYAQKHATDILIIMMIIGVLYMIGNAKAQGVIPQQHVKNVKNIQENNQIKTILFNDSVKQKVR